MRQGLEQMPGGLDAYNRLAGRHMPRRTRRRTGAEQESREAVEMEREARSERLEAVAAHPLAELLVCPPEAGNLLTGAACCVEYEAGEAVFCQCDECRGLYVVVSGNFQRKVERQRLRVPLGQARPGDLVELAAALGDGHHTYSLTAQTAGSLLLLPIEGLRQTFENYPPLRMRLLEELAREVSRAYLLCSQNRTTRTHHS